MDVGASKRRPGGSISLPKMVFDALMHGQLTSVQRDVALVVGRWTYGHEQHRQLPDGALLARSFIATECGHDPTSVKRALRQLIACGIVIEVAPHCGARPARLKLQPDVRLWHGHVVDELLASWTRTVGLEVFEDAVENAGRPRAWEKPPAGSSAADPLSAWGDPPP